MLIFIVQKTVTWSVFKRHQIFQISAPNEKLCLKTAIIEGQCFDNVAQEKTHTHSLCAIQGSIDKYASLSCAVFGVTSKFQYISFSMPVSSLRHFLFFSLTFIH